MSFETALRARIKTLPTVVQAGASVEWNRRPQGSYPALVLTLVSLPVDRNMTRQAGWRPGRVQIDVLGLDKPTVAALREAIVVMGGSGEKIGGVRFGPAQGLTVTDLSEQTDTDFVFRDMIDATYWHALET